MAEIPRARTGIVNARTFSSDVFQPWPLQAPRASLQDDPSVSPDNYHEPHLHPEHFTHYLEPTPGLDQDPYQGRGPRFPRIRRFFLNLSLKGMDEEVTEARNDLLAAHHLADRQARHRASINVEKLNPSRLKPTVSLLLPRQKEGAEENGWRVETEEEWIERAKIPIPVVGPGTSKRVQKIGDEIAEKHNEWRAANVVTFSSHHREDQEKADKLRKKFVEIPHEFGKKHKELLDKKTRKEAKKQALDTIIEEKRAKKAARRAARRTALATPPDAIEPEPFAPPAPDATPRPTPEAHRKAPPRFIVDENGWLKEADEDED